MDAIIVTHNSSRDLQRILSCRAIAESFDRIIVVDNASTDDTATHAAEADCLVISNATNLGFGAAANLGVPYTRGTAFCLLNPDIYFPDSSTVGRAANVLLDDPRVGVLAPALRLPDGSIQDSVRLVPTPANLVRRRLSPAKKHGSVTGPRPTSVPWAVGACWFVSRFAFDHVGGFDTRFFLYFEDVDLCLRLGRHGYTVRFEPSIEVEHRHVAASRRSPFGWAFRQHVRSAARFYAMHPHAILGASRARSGLTHHRDEQVGRS